jgi:hypothetical protein
MSRSHEDDKQTPARVTHRDVYEAVTDLRHEIQEGFVTKSELRMWVVLGIVGGQGVAAAITAWVTQMGPTAQAVWLYGRMKGLV